MAADLPENYEARMDAFQFIKDVPADWEESNALAGEIGEFVVFARKERGGEDWYIGAINGAAPRSIEVPLSFLSVDTRYEATIYRDGSDAHWETSPYDLVIEKRPVRDDDSLSIDLAAGGGTAISIQATH